MPEEIKKYQKFNDKSRGPYRANGYICRIDYKHKEVWVKFYTRNHYNGEDKWADFEYDEYDWDVLEGCWDERLEYWVVNRPIIARVGWLDKFVNQIKAQYDGKTVPTV